MTYRRIQDQDVKGTAEVSSDSDLINDTKIYVTANSLNKRLDQAITAGDIGGGGGGDDLASPTNFNYIANYGAETDLTGWVRYMNTTPSDKPDDFGGSTATNAILMQRNTTDPLVNTADFKLIKGALNSQGSGYYYEFTPENGHKNSMMLFSMVLGSAAGGDGEMSIWLVGSNDSFTSDFEYISPANPDIIISNKVYKQIQLGSKNDYRLCIHYKDTNTTSKEIFFFDQVFFGPKEVASGAYQRNEVIDLTSQGDFTGGSLKVSRVGNVVNISQLSNITHISSANPDVAAIIPTWARPSDRVGNMTVAQGSYLQTVLVDPTGAFDLVYRNYSGSTLAQTAADDISISYVMDDGLGDVRMSEDLGGREVFVSAKNNAGGAFTSSTDIDFTSEEADTTSSWSGTVFTAPEKGKYLFNGIMVYTTNITGDIIARVNGSNKIIKEGSLSDNLRSFTHIEELNKGDTISFRVNASATLSSSDTHKIQIYKLASPQTILETETVAARYNSSAAQSVPDNSPTTVVYENLEFNTHSGSYNTSTGIYTAPVSGLYQVSAYIRYTGHTTTGGRTYTIDVNVNSSGNAILGHETTGGITGYAPGFATSVLVKLDKGDEVEIKAYQNTGSSQNLTSQTERNIFSISRIK